MNVECKPVSEFKWERHTHSLGEKRWGMDECKKQTQPRLLKLYTEKEEDSFYSSSEKYVEAVVHT